MTYWFINPQHLGLILPQISMLLSMHLLIIPLLRKRKASKDNHMGIGKWAINIDRHQMHKRAQRHSCLIYIMSKSTLNKEL